jgi:beta/gamma crystallin
VNGGEANGLNGKRESLVPSLLQRILLAVATFFAVSTVLAAEMTLYESPNFGGRSITIRGSTANFDRGGFNDRASSIFIRSGSWEVCTDAYFRGQCTRLGPGQYRNLPPVLNNTISSVRPVGASGPGPIPGPGPGPGSGAGGGPPSIQLFERREFGGRSITLTTNASSLERLGFNDRADAAIVRGGVWRLCEHANLQGYCQDYPPGRYNDLGRLGGTLSSVAIIRR